MMLRAETVEALQVLDEALTILEATQEAVARRIREIYSAVKA
ncbi:hypothetical protein [Streptomyces sp. 2BBP-J2]|nr:hypothetical protein [Streptomyces sp. 2BBP-J2]